MKTYYFFAVFGYVGLLWLTGVIMARKTKSAEAYLVASRGLSVPFISVLIAGTWIGGVSIVGMAQGAYIHGISALWFQVGIWIAMIVTALLLDKIMQGKNTYSILDVVGSLYDKKTAKLAGILQLVFSIWVVSMQIVGGGAILSVMLNNQITFQQGMVLTAIVFTLYNVLGGFAATAYTNLIHICAIIFGIFLGGFYVIFHTGALSQMANQTHYFKPFGDLGLLQALSWAFINFTLGVLAQPVINTASSAQSLQAGKKGILIGNLIAIPVVVMAALCGIVAKYQFPEIPTLAALPILLNLTPPFIAVFFLISMWAPLMSSGSPFLMGATTLLVKGYLAPAFKISQDRTLLFVSRISTLLIGGLALVLGFFVKEILKEVTWVAVFLSAVVYIVFWGWVNKKAQSAYAFIALIGTVLIVIGSFMFGWHKVVHPIWPVTLFIVVVMGIGYFFSKGTKEPGK
jgi:SSS family solute:Na+ symporter